MAIVGRAKYTRTNLVSKKGKVLGTRLTHARALFVTAQTFRNFGHSPSSVCRKIRVASNKNVTEKCARKARAHKKRTTEARACGMNM